MSKRSIPHGENLSVVLSVVDGAKAYANLRKEIESAGILDRAYGFYFFLVSFDLLGFFASLYFIYVSSSLFLVALWCLIFTFFSIQFGGLMHDCGHRAIFKSTKNNDIFGYFCSMLLGMVFDNWKVRHNAHHAKPNEEDEDPDIEFPFIATSGAMIKRKKGIERSFVRYQAFYYYPLGAIVSFSNRLGAFSYFLQKGFAKNWWKFAIYAVGIFLLFPLPFLIFPLSKAIVVFLVVHVSSGVYLANVFAPNHKGMPQVKKGQKVSFME